jgi:Icc-related predicted phosphoesterase
MEMPPADVLVIAGDWTMRGSLEEVIAFNADLLKIKDNYKQIFVLAGNHDLLAETNRSMARIFLTAATYVEDESFDIFGYKAYASPWVPFCGDWAFQILNNNMANYVWNNIPDDTEILITHSPPYGILDTEPIEWVNEWKAPAPEDEDMVHLGDCILRGRVEQLEHLKYHVFGHIHGGYGKKKIGKVTYINCSSLKRDYCTLNKPVVITLKDKFDVTD